MVASKRVPGYLLHKSSGQAIVVLGGTMVYLGKHGSPESHTAYRRALAQWLAQPEQPAERTSAQLTVATLVDAFQAHAETYYRDADGEPTGEAANVRLALKPLRDLYGDVLARDFGPRSLEALRGTLIQVGVKADGGLARTVINQRVNVIRRAFRWAESKELVPGGTFHVLATLANLKAHRSPARETLPVRPVCWESVETILPLLPRQLAAIVQVQWWTGARPAEVLEISFDA